MAPPVQPGDSFPDWAAQRQTSPREIPRNDSTGPWSAQRQTSSRTNSKGRDVNAEAKHKMSWFAAGDRERQALLAAIERDYAPELRRISHDWVLSRGCKLQAESKNDDSDLAPPLPRYLDLSEVLGIPNVMLSAMLAAKCRDQNILATKERQQRFAEYVFANCAENSFKMKELHLGPDFAKAVALTLSFCSRYTELNLSGNALGDQGAQTMATLLLKTTTLTSVDLSANDISCKGMNFILRTMLINRSVKALDLSSKTGSNRNRFSKLNAGPLEDLLLRNSTLQRLSLSTCTLGAIGAQGLSRGLVGNQSLKFLDISQNDLGDKGACYIASVLKESALEELNLADNNICDEGLISLACSLGSLPNKMDSSSPVWSRAMEATKAATAYADSVTFLRKTVLDADEQALWPEEGSKGSAEEIKDAAKALQLAVKAAEVTLPKLKILNLTNNTATSIGVRCVADALQANNVLERLSLDHCDHRDPDNGCYSLIVSLPVNCTLRHLGLSYALLGSNGLIHLAKVVATNEVLCSLNLSGNLVDEKSASAWKITLCGNRSLKSLGMAACHIDDTAGVILAEGIGQNQGLESFSLRDNALRNTCAEAFEEALLQNGHLVQLNLELNSIHLRVLSKIKQLLDRNNKIRDKGLPDRYRTRIAELTECQKEVGRMSQVLMRNRQKKRVALWKQAAKVQKLKDEKEADRQREAQVEDRLNELLETHEQVEQEIALLEGTLKSLRADGAQKISILGTRIEDVEDKTRIGEIQLTKLRKQLQNFEEKASTELAAIHEELDRAMKAQQSAALLSTAAQRNLSTFTESLNAISEDIAGGVNPRHRWTELQEVKTRTAAKAKPRARRPT